MKHLSARRQTAAATVILVALILTLSPALCPAQPGDPTEATRRANATFGKALPFEDRQDFADATRGLVAPGPTGAIRNAEERTIWDTSVYRFLEGEAPLETVHPSLRRQAILNNTSGLFKVTERVYQVRGYDLANMAIVVGDTGYIVIDPLTSVDTARAALELVFTHLGEKPVLAVLFSHSHVDHWGGVKGVVSEQAVKAGKVKIIAPEGFLEEAVGENIFAGNAMIRRAHYMYGAFLPRGPRGQVDAGLGKSVPSRVSASLIAPTETVKSTGQTLTLDGVTMVFQMTPGTEAPANMNVFFPDLKALYLADNAVATLHNLLTPRGTQVRNAKTWAGFLFEAEERFGDRAEVVFLGHTWPRWGRANISRFLRLQADAYKYIHDQTLRLANAGYTMTEIAEEIRLPDVLARAWFNRGYYATVGWNAKAVYQHYLGWYDGNPASFDPLPPVEAGKRYVAFMGGADRLLAQAREAYERGEYRWVAQVVNHLVFADPENETARRLQADALEQLGYQCESAVFRNFYLFGAQELRRGVQKTYAKLPPVLDIFQALTLEMIFDSMAVRLNGPKASGKTIVINWHFTDTDERYALKLENAVLHHRAGVAQNADCSIRLTRELFNRIITGQTSFLARILLGQIATEGSIQKLNELMSLLDEFDPWFNIVTP